MEEAVDLVCSDPCRTVGFALAKRFFFLVGSFVDSCRKRGRRKYIQKDTSKSYA